MRAFDQRGKEILVAVSGSVGVKRTASLLHQRLRLLEGCIVDDPQTVVWHDDEILLVPFDTLAVGKIHDLVFAVYDPSDVDLVGEDPCDRVLTPFTSALGSDPHCVERLRDLQRAVAILGVFFEDHLYGFCFVLVDVQMEIVADDFVIAENEIRHSSFFGVVALLSLMRLEVL